MKSDDRPITAAAKPLSHIKVIDLTLARAGPTAVRHLADWGAEVIRIEPPAGSGANDPTASLRHSADFQNLHRNKRSMTLNLKTEAGRDTFFRLAKDADVIVENMRSNVKTRLGVDYEAVSKVNPGIVYGSISGFGQDGPYAERAGVDQIAQGMGGLMSITGMPGDGPMRVGVPISDLCAGGYLAQGILMALLHREKTNKGAWVQTSLLEAMIAMLDFQGARWTMSGEVAEQAGNNHPTATPTGVFPASDGDINIAASGQRLWERFARAAGLEALIDDPRFVASSERTKNRAALNELISEVTRQQPSAYWTETLFQAGVPCGPINRIDQTFADPQVQHLKMARPVDHPELGQITLVAHPLTITGQDRDIAIPAPERGQHTLDILRELGLDAADIETLRQQQAI